MPYNFIQRFFIKSFASQLRKPTGFMAKSVAKKMNIINEALYEFTLDNMCLEDGESLLEIGYANGLFFDKIFSKAKELKISGIDFSPEMHKAATRNNKASLASGRLDVHVGSSDSLPFGDHRFDKIFCINVVYFWDKPAQHLKEIHRVMKVGGRFYTSIRTKQSMMQMPFVQYGFSMYSQEQWIELLEASNFHVITTATLSEPGKEMNGEEFNLESLCIIAEKM